MSHVIQRQNIRLLVLAVAVIALLLVPAPSASAGGAPTRIQLDASAATIYFDAGQACTFPVSQIPKEVNGVLTEFPPLPNGDIVWRFTGRLVITYTNLTTGKALTFNVSGPGENIFHPDGSVTITGQGPGSWILPSSGSLGHALTLVYGRLVVVISPDGQPTTPTVVDRTVDLCAALA